MQTQTLDTYHDNSIAQPLPQQNTIRASDVWLNYYDPIAALESVMAHVASLPSSRTTEQHTATVYSSGIRYYLQWAGANLETGDLTNLRAPTKAALTDFIAHLMKQKYNPRSKSGAGVSAITVASKYLAPLRHYCRALLEQEVPMPDNMPDYVAVTELRHQFTIASQIKNPPRDSHSDGDKLKQHGTWLKKHQVDMLYSVCEDTLSGKRDLALMYLGFNSGLRASEITRLTLGDIRAEENYYVLEMRRKRNKKGRVTLDKQGYRLITQWIDAYNAPLDPADPRYISADMPIFQPLRAGDSYYKNHESRFDPTTPLNNKTVRNILEKRCLQVRKMGLQSMPIIRPHDMRRTTTGLLRSEGADIRVIQIKLQHDSPKTTAGYMEDDSDLDATLVSSYVKWQMPDWCA